MSFESWGKAQHATLYVSNVITCTLQCVHPETRFVRELSGIILLYAIKILKCSFNYRYLSSREDTQTHWWRQNEKVDEPYNQTLVKGVTQDWLQNSQYSSFTNFYIIIKYASKRIQFCGSLSLLAQSLCRTDDFSTNYFFQNLGSHV